MVDQDRSSSGEHRNLGAGTAWTVPAVGMAAAAPAFAASYSTGFAEAIGTTSTAATVTAKVPCNAWVRYRIIGAGGGRGGGVSTFTGGDGTMITGFFKLDGCASTAGTTVLTLIAGMPGNNTAGGAGYGTGGDPGPITASPGPQVADTYGQAAHRQGGGGGGGSAILLGSAGDPAAYQPIVVAAGGGGGGHYFTQDSSTDGAAGATYDTTFPSGGDLPSDGSGDRVGPDGTTSRFQINGPSTDTPTIVGRYVDQPGGFGAVGDTPGAAGAAGTTNCVGGSVNDPVGGNFHAPANQSLPGRPGAAWAAATGGGGANGVALVSAWPARSGSGRGAWLNYGSAGGGGGYAGGGSSGITLGASGSGTAQGNVMSVRRFQGAATGGGGAGSSLLNSPGCITQVTGTASASDIAGYGYGASSAEHGGPGYVRLEW